MAHVSFFTPRAPANVGDRIHHISTPALLLDLVEFENNSEKVKESLKPHPHVALRPHFKAHKCPAIAQYWMEKGGAHGICAQTVAEAEVLAEAGITDVAIVNEVIGEEKNARVAELTKRTRISVCVDSPYGVQQLAVAAQAAGVSVDVVVEVNVGQGRCGVEAGAQTVELVQHICATKGLVFKGLQAYHGAAQHIRTIAERRATIQRCAELIRPTLATLQCLGIPCPVVTGGGSGTFIFECETGVYTEVQPGSAYFMDVDYAKNENMMFRHALFLLGTVISDGGGKKGHVVLDTGLKAQSTDSGSPWVHAVIDGTSGEVTHSGPQLKHDFTELSVSDEHCQTSYIGEGPSPKIGDKIMMIPGHVDPTCNMHNYFVCIRKGVVEALWPISARGPSV